jgi:photosystem II Psb27 protein
MIKLLHFVHPSAALLMKRFLSSLLALVLVVAIGLTGCSSPTGLTGNYREDSLGLVTFLKTALEVPQDSPDRPALQAEARRKINDYAARYRRDDLLKLNSFTTMRTALNSLAGHYSSYPNRPVPAKLKNRLAEEFKQIELYLTRGT